MKHRYIYPFLLLVAHLSITACKKKMDVEFDNRPDQSPIINSTTRLINLAGARELQIGDVQLTSFRRPDSEGYYSADNPGKITKYFPETGQLGTTYTIPTEFVEADGYIRNMRLSSLSIRDVVPPVRSFNLKDNGRTPTDYYHVWFTPNTGALTDSMFAVPRDISPSADPQKFRIRLLNLASTPDRFDRTGALSLSWADGTAVDDRTSNIAPGSYSDYIELPYGTYQLKVLIAGGRELPAKPGGGIMSNILNPNTGTLMAAGEGVPGVGGLTDNWLNYAQLKTYQPGGVYTIVVCRSSGYSEVIPGSNGETIPAVSNSFQIISDISEPVNLTYARVQAVNAIPGRQVKWLADNANLGNTAFAGHTDYSVLVTGACTIKATDEQGAVLAEENITLQPGDNVTAWAYTAKDGKPAISFSSNNMSGFYNLPANGNDGSYAFLKDVYPCWIRFMNFCPDIEDATFTARNGALLGAEGSRHVAYGIQKISDVYTKQNVNFSTDILVYASAPAVLPGDWVSSITPLKSTAFISNTDLYKTPDKPNSEPGIYTVALVGGTAAGAAEKARMILIKHNR